MSSAQSCPAFCDPLDSGPSVHGIFQARILGWVAIFYFGVSSQPRDRTWVSWVSGIGRWILYHCTTWEAHTFTEVATMRWIPIWLSSFVEGMLIKFSVSACRFYDRALSFILYCYFISIAWMKLKKACFSKSKRENAERYKWWFRWENKHCKTVKLEWQAGTKKIKSRRKESLGLH